MANIENALIRAQLIERRRRLDVAVARPDAPDRLASLLREVDHALERLDHGTYGLCETCHDSIEPERLLANPLERFCLDHLTPAQQRALEQDLEMAALIQGRLLPARSLDVPPWRLALHSAAAGPVSGDFCDVVAPGNGGGVYFLLGDVSGKGVAASLVMAQLQAIFRSLVPAAIPPAEAVTRANRLFCDFAIHTHYSTLVLGRAHPDGRVELCNAGHVPVLWLGRTSAGHLDATGMPLGMFGESEYTAQTVRLAEGDRLVLYTDGVTETRGDADAEYGLQRLQAVCRAHAADDPAALIEACLRDLAVFRGNRPVLDDLTLLVVERQP